MLIYAYRTARHLANDAHILKTHQSVDFIYIFLNIPVLLNYRSFFVQVDSWKGPFRKATTFEP